MATAQVDKRRLLHGALEEVLTGWVMGRPPETTEEVARAVNTVVIVLVDGLTASQG